MAGQSHRLNGEHALTTHDKPGAVWVSGTQGDILAPKLASCQSLTEVGTQRAAMWLAGERSFLKFDLGQEDVPAGGLSPPCP